MTLDTGADEWRRNPTAGDGTFEVYPFDDAPLSLDGLTFNIPRETDPAP
jgi:hypothetical protein